MAAREAMETTSVMKDSKMNKLAKRMVPITAAWSLALSAYGQETPPAPPADGADAAVTNPTSPDAPAPQTTEKPATAATASAPVAGEDAAADILPSGQVVLAERMVELAQGIVRAGQLDNASLHQAATLLRAAAELNPADSRYWRLVTEAEIQLGNQEGVLTALKGLRKAAPDDRIGQIQIIEAYTKQMQSVDQQTAYLQNIVGKESIPAEVRSHAGLMLADRQLERGERATALATLEQAIKHNGVNVAALDMKYRMLAGEGSVVDRASALIAVVKANPIRPHPMAELGRMLASLGLHKDADDWMNRAIALYQRTPNAAGSAYHDLLIEYVSSLFVGGQTQLARNTVEQILKGDPNNIDAWLIKLVIDSGGTDKEAFAATQQGAANALNARWAAVARMIADEPPLPAPDAPPAAPEAAPEPAAVAEQVKASNDPNKLAAFTSVASDYAWFEMYFNGQPGAAGKWIAAMESVVSEESVTLKRLRGWLHLASNQPAEASQVLTPIADADPLAALGLLQIIPSDPEAKKASDDQARSFLQDYPSGLLGVIAHQALKSRELKPEPHPDAAAVRSLVQKFPRGWLEIADNPQRFYLLRAEPLHIAHRYGEPMFVRVTLQNLSDQDIPLGDNGVIQSGLLFDADEAMSANRIPAVAFERMTYTNVLPARSGFTQVIRFDQGNLSALLESNPTPRLQITGRVMSNPTNLGNGYGPGLAGYQVPFAKKITRVGFPIARQDAFDRAIQELQQGLPDMKIRNLSLFANYIGLFRRSVQAAAEDEANKANIQQWSAMAARLRDVMERATEVEGEVPAVTQWAHFQLAQVGEPAGRQKALETLLADKRWEGRLLGLVAARSFDPALVEPLVTNLAETEGENPLVKEFAMQAVDLIKHPPTTQPAEAAPDVEQGNLPVAVPGIAPPAIPPARDMQPPGGREVEIPGAAPADANK